MLLLILWNLIVGLKILNPGTISLFHDPWCSDIPFAYKPTFINTDLDLDALSVSDFISNNYWDFQKLECLFGSSVVDIINRLGTIDPAGINHWIWLPKSHKLKIAPNVYHFLNNKNSTYNPWPSWRKLWNIKTAPQVKHFLWLIFCGHLLISDVIHSFNLGPRNLCALCGLELEIAEHLLFLCNKAQLIWHHIGAMLGVQISFPGGFIASNWVVCANVPAFFKSVIAAVAWHI